MTDAADTVVPQLPLVCEVVCGEPLEEHVEEFRTWAALVWNLTVEALLSSGTIAQPGDVYNKALWEGVVGTGEPPHVKRRTRLLSARAWAEALEGDDLRGFGVTARPLPHVPEPTGTDSTIHLYSGWHSHHIIPNWTSWLLPARYTMAVNDAWVSRLVAGFVAFGTATRARVGLIGWTWRMWGFKAYPQAKTDYGTVLWLPGWAMLLSEGHLAKLGGVATLEQSALFRPIEQVGDGTYLVRSRTDLPDFDADRLREVESVLQPILLPPPYTEAAAALYRS
ncbi:MAG TPA: hypothetical protein VHF47_09690 [Acidimicrobiales bacterium]|nr:hypothetical protein [Acidimicrobiales bacterium]